MKTPSDFAMAFLLGLVAWENAQAIALVYLSVR